MYGFPIIPTFDRPSIKARARARLSEHYWLAFAVSLLIGMIAGNGSAGFNINLNFGERTESTTSIGLEQAMEELFGHPLFVVIIVVACVILLIALTASFAMSYFLYGPLRVGGANFFLNLSKGQPKFKDIVHGFASGVPGAYMNICKVMFLRSLYLFFWQMLMWIPCVLLVAGISLGTQCGPMALLGVIMALFAGVLMIPAIIPYLIKNYEYAMIPYLLAEYPDMTAKDAFSASKHLTGGHKWNLFVLELSFLGWMLLGAMFCGIGALFVAPYVDASMAEAYAQLCRLKAPPSEGQTEQEKEVQ